MDNSGRRLEGMAVTDVFTKNRYNMCKLQQTIVWNYRTSFTNFRRKMGVSITGKLVVISICFSPRLRIDGQHVEIPLTTLLVPCQSTPSHHKLCAETVISFFYVCNLLK